MELKSSKHFICGALFCPWQLLLFYIQWLAQLYIMFIRVQTQEQKNPIEFVLVYFDLQLILPSAGPR